MKTEISAGGVVVKKFKKGYKVLCILDMSSNWTFPKGLIEKNEKPIDAARREIGEETGVTGAIYLKNLPPVEYFYHRNGKIHKIVKYYLLETGYNGRFKPQKEEGIQKIRWLTPHQALAKIGYRDTNVPMLQKAFGYLGV